MFAIVRVLEFGAQNIFIKQLWKLVANFVYKNSLKVDNKYNTGFRQNKKIRKSLYCQYNQYRQSNQKFPAHYCKY